MKKNIILSAFNVHTGGGLVLLKGLLKTNLIKIKLLDHRVKNKISFSKNIIFVKKKIIDRIYKFHLACYKSNQDDTIICFNGLPPLFRVKAKVILFIQTFYFFANISNFNFNLYTSLRINFEKVWLLIGLRNVNEIWVQTNTMKKRLLFFLKKQNIKKNIIVKVMPLIDDETQKIMGENIFFSKTKDNQNYFFYPADGAGHKNHIRLIKAFLKLDEKYKLYLTLNSKDFLKISKKFSNLNSEKTNIINLGQLPRKKILDFYRRKIDTLIFPSLDESFGIPLIEACIYNKNIMASNSNYAKDILYNFEKFNPYSVNSISNTVRKFIRTKNKKKTKLKKIKFINSKKFLNSI